MADAEATTPPVPARLAADLGLFAARLLLGGMFVWLAIGKLQDPPAFLKAVRAYEILPSSPPWLLNGVAVSLPWIELLGGTLLILGLLRRGVAVVLAASLLLFTTAIFFRAQGIHASEGTPFCSIAFDCGCGTGETLICWKLAENLLLLAVAVFLVFAPSGRLALSALAGRGARKHA
ncbi:MAG TPA: MauE/DoxX family redox-associated membrane protein [Planctomycetota bacterium]